MVNPQPPRNNQVYPPIESRNFAGLYKGKKVLVTGSGRGAQNIMIQNCRNALM